MQSTRGASEKRSRKGPTDKDKENRVPNPMGRAKKGSSSRRKRRDGRKKGWAEMPKPGQSKKARNKAKHKGGGAGKHFAHTASEHCLETYFGCSEPGTTGASALTSLNYKPSSNTHKKLSRVSNQVAAQLHQKPGPAPGRKPCKTPSYNAGPKARGTKPPKNQGNTGNKDLHRKLEGKRQCLANNMASGMSSLQDAFSPYLFENRAGLYGTGQQVEAVRLMEESIYNQSNPVSNPDADPSSKRVRTETGAYRNSLQSGRSKEELIGGARGGSGSRYQTFRNGQGLGSHLVKAINSGFGGSSFQCMGQGRYRPGTSQANHSSNNPGMKSLHCQMNVKALHSNNSLRNGGGYQSQRSIPRTFQDFGVRDKAHFKLCTEAGIEEGKSQIYAQLPNPAPPEKGPQKETNPEAHLERQCSKGGSWRGSKTRQKEGLQSFFQNLELRGKKGYSKQPLPYTHSHLSSLPNGGPSNKGSRKFKGQGNLSNKNLARKVTRPHRKSRKALRSRGSSGRASNPKHPAKGAPTQADSRRKAKAQSKGKAGSEILASLVNGTGRLLTSGSNWQGTSRRKANGPTGGKDRMFETIYKERLRPDSKNNVRKRKMSGKSGRWAEGSQPKAPLPQGLNQPGNYYSNLEQISGQLRRNPPQGLNQIYARELSTTEQAYHSLKTQQNSNLASAQGPFQPRSQNNFSLRSQSKYKGNPSKNLNASPPNHFNHLRAVHPQQPSPPTNLRVQKSQGLGRPHVSNLHSALNENFASIPNRPSCLTVSCAEHLKSDSNFRRVLGERDLELEANRGLKAKAPWKQRKKPIPTQDFGNCRAGANLENPDTQGDEACQSTSRHGPGPETVEGDSSGLYLEIPDEGLELDEETPLNVGMSLKLNRKQASGFYALDGDQPAIEGDRIQIERVPFDESLQPAETTGILASRPRGLTRNETRSHTANNGSLANHPNLQKSSLSKRARRRVGGFNVPSATIDRPNGIKRESKRRLRGMSTRDTKTLKEAQSIDPQRKDKQVEVKISSFFKGNQPVEDVGRIREETPDARPLPREGHRPRNLHDFHEEVSTQDYPAHPLGLCGGLVEDHRPLEPGLQDCHGIRPGESRLSRHIDQTQEWVSNDPTADPDLNLHFVGSKTEAEALPSISILSPAVDFSQEAEQRSEGQDIEEEATQHVIEIEGQDPGHRLTDPSRKTRDLARFGEGQSLPSEAQLGNERLETHDPREHCGGIEEEELGENGLESKDVQGRLRGLAGNKARHGLASNVDPKRDALSREQRRTRGPSTRTQSKLADKENQRPETYKPGFKGKEPGSCNAQPQVQDLRKAEETTDRNQPKAPRAGLASKEARERGGTRDSRQTGELAEGGEAEAIETEELGECREVEQFQFSRDFKDILQFHVGPIMRHLGRQESKCRVEEDYFKRKQRQVDSKMREVLVDWLIEVHNRYKMRDETIFLAVRLVDRYLALRQVEYHRFQLLGTACLMIAAKYEEIYPPKVKDFVYICANAYTRAEVLDMESEVLTLMDFDLVFPTSIQFFGFFQKVHRFSKLTSHLVHYILYAALIQHSFVQTPPRLLAYSAVLMAHKAFKDADEARRFKAAFRAGFEDSQVNYSIFQIYNMLLSLKKTELSALRSRFSAQRYGNIAQIEARVH